MTDHHLSERMPDVAGGTESWTATELRHLVECRECAAEWRMVRRVAAGGPRVAIDADRLADAVVERLRHESAVIPIASRQPWRRWAIGLAAAASVALAVAIWRPWVGAARELAIEPARERTLLPELDALLEAELEVVLATLEPAPVEPLGTVPRLGDLTDDELELLLEHVEGS